MSTTRLGSIAKSATTIAVLVAFATVSADSAGPSTTNAPSNLTAAGGGGAARSSLELSDPRSPVKSMAEPSAAQGSQPATRHQLGSPDPLGCPDRFDMDGVYIWCDPDGTWTVSWRSPKIRTLSVHAKSDAVLEPVATSSLAAKVSQSEPRSLSITNDQQSKAGVVQFRSGAGSVTFDVLIDGERDLSKVCVGAASDRPTTNSFAVRTPAMDNASDDVHADERMIASGELSADSASGGTLPAASTGGGGGSREPR